MQVTHEPRDEFIERLEGRISAEARRRHRPAQAPPWMRWMPYRPIQAALAVAALVIVSMGIGGAVVAAAYQAQTNEQRDLLASTYQRRAELARQRLSIAHQQLQTAEERLSLGMEGQEAVLEGQFKVAEAEAQLGSIELQLAEVRMTGREPLDAVSSPLVSGRDFLSERWRIEMSVPAAALRFEKTRLASAQRRMAVGAADRIDVEVSQTRIIEIEAAIEAFQRKIDIRQRFLKREMDAALADLRVLEGEAEQRRTTLAPKLDLARKQLKNITTKVEIGVATRVELAEAQLRLKELELDLSKADVDLAVIRRQIEQHRIEG